MGWVSSKQESQKVLDPTWGGASNIFGHLTELLADLCIFFLNLLLCGTFALNYVQVCFLGPS